MKRHWSYLKYLIKHKYWVFVAGHYLAVSYIQLLLHDWHKFLPDEWFAYAKTFYHKDGKRKYDENYEPLKYAWNKHQKRGKHHWQAFLLTWDEKGTEALPMPPRYIREMVADWFGAGKTITGKWEAKLWYEKHKSGMILETKTRELAEHYVWLLDKQLNEHSHSTKY